MFPSHLYPPPSDVLEVGHPFPQPDQHPSHLYPPPSDVLEVGHPFPQPDQHPGDGLTAGQLGNDGQGGRVVAQGGGASGSPGHLLDCALYREVHKVEISYGGYWKDRKPISTTLEKVRVSSTCEKTWSKSRCVRFITPLRNRSWLTNWHQDLVEPVVLVSDSKVLKESVRHGDHPTTWGLACVKAVERASSSMHLVQSG